MRRIQAADPRPARRTRPARRALATALGGALLSSGLIAPASSPAHAAQDVSYRPASGVFTVQGRGFGHGRGMSQWGAYGAAVSGLSWRQILDFYYPGTFRDTVTGSTLRVWISGDDDGSTAVRPAAGLSVTTGSTTRALPSGPAYRAWRAVRSGDSLAVQYLDAAGAWRPASVAPAADIAFTASSGVVPLILPSAGTQHLRGSVHAALDGSRVRTIVHTTMESYLRGVVPAEMPASWHGQALAAQSVAARTYAASYRASQRAKGAAYDICDSQACQVFTGAAKFSATGVRTGGEDSRADAAIMLTAGTVLRTSRSANASYAFAEFSASNGGYTVAGGPFYQVAKADPYDGKLANPSTSWTRPVTAAALERAYPVGTLRAVRVLSRDGRGADGGRVKAIALLGSRGVVTTTGAAMRLKLGLKSDWFSVTGGVTSPPLTKPPAGANRPSTPAIAAPRDLDGDGRADVATLEADGTVQLRTFAADGAPIGTRRIGVGFQRMSVLVNAGQVDGVAGEDLLALERATGRLLLYPGDGTGRLGRPRVVAGGLAGIRSLSDVGDVDGNGSPDLVVLDGRGRLLLLPGRSGGGYAAAKVSAVAWSATRVAGVGDATGDGRPDVVSVAARGGRLGLYAGTTAGGFTAATTFGRGWAAMRSLQSVGDVTGDRRADLLARDSSSRLLLFPSVGDGYGAPRVIG